MKHCLLFFYGILLVLLCCSNEDKSVQNKHETEIAVPASESLSPANELLGQWKKIAYGPDDNQNGKLDDAEKEKSPEAGSYDVLYFYNGGKYMYSGILGETRGDYAVKNINGKKTILLYDLEMPTGLSEKEKDQWSAQFQVRSMNSNTMVVVPPIYLFMLVVYERVKKG